MGVKDITPGVIINQKPAIRTGFLMNPGTNVLSLR